MSFTAFPGNHCFETASRTWRGGGDQQTPWAEETAMILGSPRQLELAEQGTQERAAERNSRDLQEPPGIFSTMLIKLCPWLAYFSSSEETRDSSFLHISPEIFYSYISPLLQMLWYTVFWILGFLTYKYSLEIVPYL